MTKFYLLDRNECFDLSQVILRFTVIMQEYSLLRLQYY